MGTLGIIGVLVATVLISALGVWAINRHMRKKYPPPPDFKPKPIPFLSPNEARAAVSLPVFEDFDIDYNKHVFLREVVHFCERHKFTLDSVQMSPKPAEDLMMFSCKNFESYPEGVRQCSATRVIERYVFWDGPKKIRELYVDPDWQENYENYMYNRNMRDFEKAMASPLMYISESPKAPFPDYKD